VFLRKWIRGCVRATHEWPGPKHLYRYLYRRAAQEAGKLAGGRLIGVYARNSYALGTWVAGISDIDLTVVWRNASNADVNDCQRRFDALRARYPMIGEVEMLEERHVAAWTAHATTGLESRNWIRLGGDYELKCAYRGDEKLDRLRQAVSIYRYNLTPLFGKQDDSAFFRFAAKLFRQLSLPAPDLSGRGELLAACMAALCREIRRLPADPSDPRFDYDRLLGPRDPSCSHGDGYAAIGYAHDTAPRYLLVPAGTNRIESAEACVMDADLFRFYLSWVDPLEYFTLLLSRKIFSGSDPLAQPFPLGERGLRSTVQHYSVQMLSFPFRRDLDTMPEGEFRDCLYGWFLRTLRFFEDGRMDFAYYSSLREYFGTRHAETGERRALLLAVADDLAPHLLDY